MMSGGKGRRPIPCTARSGRPIASGCRIASTASTVNRELLMHKDSQAVQAILRRHTNVKLCVSGHLHLVDHVVYDGITYRGCGAVSGDWWKGDTFYQTH